MTGRARYWPPRAARFRPSRRSSRTQATRARTSRPPPASPSRSSAASPIRSASLFSLGAGPSGASSLGTIEADGFGRTPKPPSPQRQPSSTQSPPWSASDLSRERHESPDGLLDTRLTGEHIKQSGDRYHYPDRLESGNTETRRQCLRHDTRDVTGVKRRRCSRGTQSVIAMKLHRSCPGLRAGARR